MIQSDNLKALINKTVQDFLSSGSAINISDLKIKDTELEEISGPTLDVHNDNYQYTLIASYEAKFAPVVLELLIKKFPFLLKDELPEIDVLDFFGEFLNILSGKINLSLDDKYPNLNIDIPYYAYETDLSNQSNDTYSMRVELDGLVFDIFFVQQLVN